MASCNWNVCLPDGSQRSFPRSFTAEEVRVALASSGIAGVSSATLTVDGDTLRFSRPQGGSKA